MHCQAAVSNTSAFYEVRVAILNFQMPLGSENDHSGPRPTLTIMTERISWGQFFQTPSHVIYDLN